MIAMCIHVYVHACMDVVCVCVVVYVFAQNILLPQDSQVLLVFLYVAMQFITCNEQQLIVTGSDTNSTFGISEITTLKH